VAAAHEGGEGRREGGRVGRIRGVLPGGGALLRLLLRFKLKK